MASDTGLRAAPNECDHCGGTVAACDSQLRETGATCCAGCLIVDTHGVAHGEDQRLARRVAGMDKVVTQVVADNILFRNELVNKQVGPMLRRLEALEQQVAKLAHDVEHVPPAERRVVLGGFVAEVREIAEGMSKRLRIVEACIEGIEGRLKLRRKTDPEQVIAMLDAHR